MTGNYEERSGSGDALHEGVATLCSSDSFASFGLAKLLFIIAHARFAVHAV